MSTALKSVTLPTESLYFDKQNPRLAEYGINDKTSENDILEILWNEMDIRELVQSIAASGFFQHESLIVSKEKNKNVVIEGNRRLAAVKVLLNPSLADENGWEIPRLTTREMSSLKDLPAIVTDRNQAWRYLGFKHVNGPAKWSSYAKAKYIAEVHKQYKISLVDIADQIGDRHNTVQRLFRGLMVIEQAERKGVFDREDRSRTRLAFSHLYTGLQYEGISSFLDLKPEISESKAPVPTKKIQELGEFLVWLYGSKSKEIPPVVESQNPHLRQLNSVVTSREAVSALRAGVGLSKAYEISRPATSVFEESLLSAKRSHNTARSYLTEGFDNSESLLRIAGSIADMADDLYREMERKMNPEKKKRISEE